MNGELHLRFIMMTDVNCLLIATILKCKPIINVLNLSDCFLSLDGLKNILDVVNKLEHLSHLNLKGNQIGNDHLFHIAKILLNNYSITKYDKF